MELYKNIIITTVTVLTIISSVFGLVLINKSEKHRRDVTFPLIVSVFVSGLTHGIMGILASFECWMDLRNNQELMKWIFFFNISSCFMDHVLLVVLAIIKLLAVTKPFYYLRVINTKRILVITICIWLILLAGSSPVVITRSEILTFDNITQYPKMKPAYQIYVNYAFGIAYLIVFTILTLVSITLFIVTVKHAMKSSRPVKKQKARPLGIAVAAIWTSKGTLTLSLIRVPLILPYVILLGINSETNHMFYAKWICFTIPFWDVFCIVICSECLRKLALKTFVCKKYVPPRPSWLEQNENELNKETTTTLI